MRGKERSGANRIVVINEIAGTSLTISLREARPQWDKGSRYPIYRREGSQAPMG